MTWGTFPPIFQLHPDSIPVWKERIADLEKNHFPTSICSFQKVEKQNFCKFWAELFPPSMYVLLAKKWKTELENVDRIHSRHLPVPCSTATRDPDTWGNNEMRGKTFKGSYSYKTRWNPGRCLKSEASSIMAKTLTSKNITKKVQNLCSNCNWQTPG